MINKKMIDKETLRKEKIKLGVVYAVCAVTAVATIASIGAITYAGLVKHFTPTEQTRNVMGNKEPEKYVDVNGRRYYSEVDGKSVESLVK